VWVATVEFKPVGFLGICSALLKIELSLILYTMLVDIMNWRYALKVLYLKNLAIQGLSFNDKNETYKSVGTISTFYPRHQLLKGVICYTV
jgi:hypothetical protein